MSLPTMLPASGLSWPVLASNENRDQILNILTQLDQSLVQEPEKFPNLSGGMAGTALLFGYMAKLPGREQSADRAMECLSQAVDRVELTPGAQFFSGYSGIAWAVEHLQREVFGPLGFENDGEDANEGVDEVLLDLLSVPEWCSDYDLISGLAGYGVYALERLDVPTSKSREILMSILKHLEKLAIQRPVGLAWPTGPELLPPWQRELAPKGYLNLGLAHGNPAVLLLLAAMFNAGIEVERARPLLEGGVAWLLSQFQEVNETTDSYLAGWCPVDLDRADEKGSRVAWCYGDLGASLALLQTARLVGNAEWEQKALEMARHAAGRPLETSGVRDVGLCHGSAGNMVIFMRFFQMTGETCFLETSRRYLDHLINTRTPEGSFGGYTAYKPATTPDGKLIEGDNPNKPDSGLLEGATGVGLALLAALGVEPNWDRFMMLSTRLM